MSRWRSIDTAPKDGAKHLRWSEECGFAIANQPSINHAPGEWSVIRGKWKGAMSIAACRATHWKPLPQPPKE